MMEFPFDINDVLPFEITILNGDFRILNQGQTSRVSGADKLNVIIDAVGEASYKAQNLPAPVTTARKFRINDHRLYLMKEQKNRGSVVGLLKVGEKHLYVYDSHGQVHERTPLCLLDFYVHESKQRSGFGRKLFDAMLEFEKCQAHELAIDRPSNKCLAFLQKHFQLSAPIRQVNNFVVFNAFFNRPMLTLNRRNTENKQQQQEKKSWGSTQEITANRRPFSEQNDPRRLERTETNEFRKTSPFVSPLKDPFRTMPRTYNDLFNENNPFPSLQRYNSNPLIAPVKPVTNFTYKDYQSASAQPGTRRQPEPPQTKAEPLTSIYTFPSLIKANAARWQRTTNGPATSKIDANSSAWRLFGVNRLTN